MGEGLDLASAERALALERAAPPAAVDTRLNFKLGQWLRYVDDLDGARRRLAEAETSAREEGDESSLPNILLNRALAECWAGNLRDASELGEEARDAFRQAGIAPAASDIWKAYVDAHLGRVDAVREAALARGDVDEPIVRMIWERTVGLAELSAGDVVAADRHLSEAMRLLDEMDFAEPAVWRIDGDAAESALGVGDLDRGEALVSRFESRAARSQIPWSLAVSARCRALLHAARGELDEALASVERSLNEHDRCPVPFERARTLLVHGQILRRLKQKRLARTVLEEAHALFARLGAELWEARAQEELQRVTSRSAPDDLSPTELRIAQLAATGRTNNEIAAEVFVTSKTVEANLARVYRKLGIRSRAQLAHALDLRETQTIS
jgi:DNA-binding CsgD family transcriptional regulator